MANPDYDDSKGGESSHSIDVQVDSISTAFDENDCANPSQSHQKSSGIKDSEVTQAKPKYLLFVLLLLLFGCLTSPASALPVGSPGSDTPLVLKLTTEAANDVTCSHSSTGTTCTVASDVHLLLMCDDSDDAKAKWLIKKTGKPMKTVRESGVLQGCPYRLVGRRLAIEGMLQDCSGDYRCEVKHPDNQVYWKTPRIGHIESNLTLGSNLLPLNSTAEISKIIESNQENTLKFPLLAITPVVVLVLVVVISAIAIVIYLRKTKRNEACSPEMNCLQHEGQNQDNSNSLLKEGDHGDQDPE